MEKAKRFFGKVRHLSYALPVAAMVAVPGLASATLTVPDIATTYVEDSAGKVFVALGVFVAICMGISLFRRAGR